MNVVVFETKPERYERPANRVVARVKMSASFIPDLGDSVQQTQAALRRDLAV